MRNLLITLLLIVLMIPTLAQEDDEDLITIPDLNGLTAPEAAARLNAEDMLLNPIFELVSSEDYDGEANTIVIQDPAADTEVEPDTQISVTVSIVQDPNVLLVFYNPTLENQNIEREHFTIINTSDSGINIDGLVFRSENREFIASDWRDSVIRSNYCFQLSSNPNNGYHQPAECNTLAGTGILQGVSSDEQFWKESGTFTVLQDGVYRGKCEIEARQCALWVSPDFVSEDVTEYAYFVYDEHELVVYNRSEKQWMPLHQIELDNSQSTLDNLAMWSTSLFDDLTFLAPQQCVVFTDGSRRSILDDCFSIAQKNSTNNNIFWSDGFTVTSLGTEHSCPAPSGKTFCLVPRKQLDN